MSREIKFRAWDCVDNRWLSPKIFQIRGDGNVMCGREHIVIMQFTGLRDKNGKEIYEGDIVNFNGRVVVIEWNEAEGCFWGGSHNQRFILQYTDMLLVMGNIYEHPDLVRYKDE